jgi:macrodomain Ter protein organizer (MatP/YcbG family)
MKTPEYTEMEKKTLFIAHSIWERLRVVARRDGTSISDLVRRALVEFLSRAEK